MKTVVIFYSYSGSTKVIAEKLAAEESADIAEIKDANRPGKLKAYTAGIIASIRGKAWPIQSFGIDFAEYDRLILLAPVWAGNPPPAFNAMLNQLPERKTIAVKMISKREKSDCRNRLEKAIKAKNGILESFEDIRA
jgi:flavodoxin